FNRWSRCPDCLNNLFAIVAEPGRILVECWQCGCEFEVDEKHTGHTVRCTNCDETIRVPVEPIIVYGEDKPRRKSPAAQEHQQSSTVAPSPAPPPYDSVP